MATLTLRHRIAVAATACALCLAMPAAVSAPDEELLGRADGYPIGTRATWFFDERARVGSFSHLDRIFPHNTLTRSASPRSLPPASGEFALSYVFQGQTLSLDDFLARQRITGLLIIKDGHLLVERYQYERTSAHRFVSHSMAKSIVSLAVGLALAEKRIESLDDELAKYEPRLAGVPYGKTAIRDFLHMASGVPFREVYDGKDDLARFVSIRNSRGSIEALRSVDARANAPGTRFQYASSETVALAVLLRAVTGMSLSEYLTTRLWQPMGAEGDATWVTSRDGLEVAGGSFNAVLRDYGRLGMLLADDGAIDGRQILPRDYLIEATDWRRQPSAFTPSRATAYFGYGYQFWLFPGEKRRFALLGVYGQSMFVDPQLKLVMVITAAARNASVGKETLAAERNAVWRALVQKFGAW